ncbi:hypothetical protein MMC30_003831 [Trapelia coarctata]|nr:hypothetical protein [Trapelia coarctata]
MAPKKPAKEEQRDETLQAVVLADTYERKFSPFTLEKPRCLLPLANTPLIEYTLEFLAHAGVEDIFVYCGAHPEQVEQYISSSKWKLPTSPFRTLTLLKSTASSVGDALRDLDKRDLITGDFLLVSGDVVSNLPIEQALAKHRARREKDKNAIMTIILREAGVEHRAKSRGRRPVFVVEPSAERILHYEEMTRRAKGERYIHIDPDILSSHREIDIREDVVDCYIDICTPDVLSLWSDNFDYQSVRKSFLFGVLKDYELNGKTLHYHMVQDYYCARVKSLRAYDTVSKDIGNRWTYPLCPDSNLVRDQAYKFQHGHSYFEDGVVLARNCHVNGRSVVGRGTSIGEGTIVTNSVIGRNCQIGKNATVSGSYIWDGAIIGPGSIVTQSVIANSAKIGQNCVLEPGALISFSVTVADNSTIKSASRLTTAPVSDSSSDSDASDASADSANLIDLPRSASSTSLSSVSTIHSSPDSNSDLSLPSRPSSPSLEAANPTFHAEATASILDGLTKGDSPEVIHLELLSQRLGANANDHMMRAALVSAFVNRVSNMIEGGTGANEAVKQVFGKYKELLTQLAVFDKEGGRTGGVGGGVTRPDQVDLLNLVEKECEGREKGENLLLFVATECFQKDVVEEEGVLEWWEGGGGEGGGRDQGEGTPKVRIKVKELVEYLKKEDSSEEEEEEEEDDDDDDK